MSAALRLGCRIADTGELRFEGWPSPGSEGRSVSELSAVLLDGKEGLTA